MSVRDGLIRILADGELHGGSALAAALGVSRSAVWKEAHRLGELGLELRQDRRGYRLSRAVELLDERRIVAALGAEARSACERLEVLAITESTNDLLVAAPVPAPGAWRAALAEFQTRGRGRRGRRWLSPLGSGLILSMSWCFAAAPRELPALSLAAAVAVARALEAAGATGIGLKWPNDVLHAGGKLAGVLVDVDGDARGPLRAVVGIGLNLAVSERLGGRIAADGGLPAAALECALPGGVQRNALAAGLLTSLYGVFHEFSLAGFAPFAAEWERRDCLRGQEVCVREAAGERRGIARGVAADGALLLQQPGGMAAVVNGEVSLRAGP